MDIGKRSSSLRCVKRNVPTNRSYDVMYLVVWMHLVILFYYATLLQNDSSNLWRHHYKLNHTAESLEMAEEQCHRPSERWKYEASYEG